jgi:hypothetical protein
MSAKEGVPFYHLNAIPPTSIPNRPCNNCEYFIRKYRTSGVCCNSIVACVDWSGFKAKGNSDKAESEDKE